MTAERLRTVRHELARRLRASQSDLEREVSALVHDLHESADEEDPEYELGLRAAIAESLSFGVLSIEVGDEWPVPVPPAVAAQARRAAGAGVSLATVMRRCSAGNMLFEAVIIGEAEGLDPAAVGQILRERVIHVDRLLGAIAENHTDARRREHASVAQRRAETLERLLNEDVTEPPEEIAYDFDAWHVGAVLVGAEAGEAAAAMGRDAGLRVLSMQRNRATAWVWVGSTRQPQMGEVERWLLDTAPSEVSVAVGAARQGLGGWRLTHREALAAVRIVLRQPSRLTHACEVALLAAILKDETLVRSLLNTYLTPLNRHPESGQTLRETARVYLEAGCNAAAAASTLNVHRHTVQRRIRTVEELIGRILPSCHAELQIALRLAELDPDTYGAETA